MPGGSRRWRSWRRRSAPFTHIWSRRPWALTARMCRRPCGGRGCGRLGSTGPASARTPRHAFRRLIQSVIFFLICLLRLLAVDGDALHCVAPEAGITPDALVAPEHLAAPRRLVRRDPIVAP